LVVIPKGSLSGVKPWNDGLKCVLRGTSRVKEEPQLLVLAENPRSKARSVVMPKASYKPINTTQWNAILPLPADMDPHAYYKFW
jgi:hypothetical protein